MFKKSIGVIVPLFDVTLCLLMLHYLKLPRFTLIVTSSGEEEDLLVDTLTSPIVSPEPTLVTA